MDMHHRNINQSSSFTLRICFRSSDHSAECAFLSDTKIPAPYRRGKPCPDEESDFEITRDRSASDFMHAFFDRKMNRMRLISLKGFHAVKHGNQS